MDDMKKLTDFDDKKKLIGCLVVIEGAKAGYHHWGVIVDVDRDDIFMIHLTTDSRVTRTLLAEYAGDRDVRIHDNKLFSYKKPFEPQEIVKRAKSKLGKLWYNLLFNNCEHFAKWCRYGTNESGQVTDKVDRAKTIFEHSMVILLFPVPVLALKIITMC